MPANTSSDTDANDTGSSLVWGTSSFEPGGDVGLVSRNTVALIARDNPSTRERLWQFVASDAPVDDVLDELSSTGLRALPDFGIAQVEGEAVRVVARGRTTITAELASGEQREIDPSGVRTWIEEVVSDVVGLTIALSPLDDDAPVLSTEAFAVLAGSVPARSVSRRFDVADPHADQASAGWAAQAGASPGDAASTVGEIDAPRAAHVEEEAVEEEAVEEEAVEEEAAQEDAADEFASDDVEVAAESGTDLAAADDVDLEMVEPDDANDGDSWFTDHAEGSPAAEVPPQPGGPTDGPVSAPPADPQPASPQPTGPPTAAHPASHQPASPQPASPQPAGPPVGPGRGGPPPEATIVVGSADGPVRGPVTSIFDDEVFDQTAAPTLPADAPTAGTPGADTAAPVAAAPVHGVLAFSNGERINVDRSVLIGRNPKVAGAVDGGLPHIMKFEGPGQGLSRTHAEVRVENGEMLLEDLQSTNGTEVQLPGQQRRRLRGGEPVVVVPGTLIDFGDELHCTVETAG